MAITSYDELKAAIASWKSNRTDIPADDCVTLAEARLNRDLRLRTMEASTPLVATAGSQTVPVPTGFLEPLALMIERATGREPLTFRPAGMPTSATEGEPRFWTVDADNIAFERPCDHAYSFVLRHLQRFQLSDGAPSNWLLANHPDAYLAACGVAAALWLEDDDHEARWARHYAAAKDDINGKDHRSRALTRLRTDAAIQPQALRPSAFDITRGL